MQSLQVRTGEISLQILDDEGTERGIFKFNPDDVQSAKRIFFFFLEFDVKSKEFDKRIEAAETTEDKVTILDEMVTYFEEVIDSCFGEGSSQVLFGNAKSLTMFDDFFEGILPYYQKASEKRMSKYTKLSKNGK